MDKILLSASAKDEVIKVLGLEVANAKMGKLRIKINGVDLMRDIVLDEIEISAEVDPIVPAEIEEKK